ncbi:MAG: hypothetical protein VX737_05035 [Pseudomonadota bacterium]|nr:hypothetical protein [Pseudomonadota bacterium]
MIYKTKNQTQIKGIEMGSMSSVIQSVTKPLGIKLLKEDTDSFETLAATIGLRSSLTLIPKVIPIIVATNKKFEIYNTAGENDDKKRQANMIAILGSVFSRQKVAPEDSPYSFDEINKMTIMVDLGDMVKTAGVEVETVKGFFGKWQGLVNSETGFTTEQANELIEDVKTIQTQLQSKTGENERIMRIMMNLKENLVQEGVNVEPIQSIFNKWQGLVNSKTGFTTDQANYLTQDIKTIQTELKSQTKRNKKIRIAKETLEDIDYLEKSLTAQKILPKMDYLKKGLEMAKDKVDFMSTRIFNWDKEPTDPTGKKLTQKVIDEITEPRDYVKELLYPQLKDAVMEYQPGESAEIKEKLMTAVNNIPDILRPPIEKYTQYDTEKAKSVSADSSKKTAIKEAIAEYKSATAEPEESPAVATTAVATEATATAESPAVAVPVAEAAATAEEATKKKFLEDAEKILLPNMTSETQFDPEILLQEEITTLKEATKLTDENIKTLVDNLKSKLAPKVEMAKIRAAIEKRDNRGIFGRSKVTEKVTEKAQRILDKLEGPDHGLKTNDHLTHLEQLSKTLENRNQNTKEKLEALKKQHTELEEKNTGDNKPAQT